MKFLIAVICILALLAAGRGAVENFSAFFNVSLAELLEISVVGIVGSYVVFWINRRNLRDSLSQEVHLQALDSIVKITDSIEAPFVLLTGPWHASPIEFSSDSKQHPDSRITTPDIEAHIHVHIRQLNNEIHHVRLICSSPRSMFPSAETWKVLHQKSLQLKSILTERFPSTIYDYQDTLQVRRLCQEIRFYILETRISMIM